MPPSAAQFKHLHDLQRQLKEVQDHLARGPRQIKARQKRVEEAELLQTTREQELKDARAQTDRKNLDLRSKEAHLTDLQGKLNTASSNREYDIIRGQMDADRAAKAVLEDEILEWLDRVDASQTAIAEAKTAVAQTRSEVQQFATEFERRAVDWHRQEADLKQQIAEAETIVPAEQKELYRRLVEAHGSEALASVEKGVCTQCYVSLTPQTRVELNSGKLLVCSSCGRLMYPGE